MSITVITLLSILGPAIITGGVSIVQSLINHKTTTAVSANHTAQITAAATAGGQAALQSILASGTVDKASATQAGLAAAAATVQKLIPGASAGMGMPSGK